MLQIVILLGCVYLVVKGLEITVIAVSSDRPNQGRVIGFSFVILLGCIVRRLCVRQHGLDPSEQHAHRLTFRAA